jgi:hypothetical protein
MIHLLPCAKLFALGHISFRETIPVDTFSVNIFLKVTELPETAWSAAAYRVIITLERR